MQQTTSARREMEACPWIAYYKPRASARLRLFCFHYAGGSASAFRTWPDALPEEIEVCPIQLPGREQCLWEPPFTRVSFLLDHMHCALQPYMDLPFAFVGHSMGAVIAFELARELRRQNHEGPFRVFVSGCRAPQLPNPKPFVHLLSEEQLIAHLRRHKGTSESVLQNADLMHLLLPIIQADFALYETYVYEEQEPLACPITAFGGLQDIEASGSDLAAWQGQTRSAFALHMYSGDHFFLHSAQVELLHQIAR